MNADLHSLQWLLTYRLKRSRRLQLPRISIGQKRPQSLRLHRRRLSSTTRQVTWRKRFCRFSFQMRRNQHPRHGTPRRRQHRNLWSPSPNQSAARTQKGQSNPGLRPRPHGPRRNPQTNTGQRHQRLHSRRNAPNPRLPRTQKVPQLLRTLRHRMAKPAKRIRPISQAPS